MTDLPENGKKKVTIKVGMIGDSQVGKTSLMVKYVEGNYTEDYIQTLGVNFMEKTIELQKTDITFSIWDLGGQFIHDTSPNSMLGMAVHDAVACLFMFDLTRMGTLTSVKAWYKKVREKNKTAQPFLVGTKYDKFANLPDDEKADITKQARRFAKAMKAPLIFCSSFKAINIQKIFKVVLSKVFGIKCSVKKVTEVGYPLIEYDIGDDDEEASSISISDGKEEDE